MARQIVNSARVTPYRNPLSHAVKAGGFVFLSGITPFKGEREIAIGDFGAQMRQAIENIRLILEDAGSSFDKIARLGIYLRHEADFREMNEIFRSYYPDGDYPARTTVIAGTLPGEHFLVQIDGIAEA